VRDGSADPASFIAKVGADGFCVFPGLLSRSEVGAAREELVALLEADLAYRTAKGIAVDDHWLDGFHYSLTPLMHTMLFPAFLSAQTAGLIEQVMASPLVAEVLRTLIGDEYRLRVDLVRRASGKDDTVDDFQLPHEWHRDTPGEFTLGIFLDDMSEPNSGGTTVIGGGTHMLPFDPIWDFMLGEKSFTTKANFLKGHCVWVNQECRRLHRYNDKLRRELSDRVVEIRGQVGDAYLFLNDTWHGRAPNRQGKRFMTIRFGGFPTDFAFKNDLPVPKATAPLPPLLARRYREDQPRNAARDLLIHRTRHATPPLLPRLAHWEKRLAIGCTEAKAVRDELRKRLRKVVGLRD
jgi:hypothetical protein